MVEYLGIGFAYFLEPLLIWIRTEGIGQGIALIIIFLGIAIGFVILRFCVNDLRLIRKAKEVLQQGQSEQDFATNYNLINEDLLSIKKIDFAWSEFSETLLLPTTSDDGILRPCSNTQRPHDFFNLDDLHMGPQFTKSLPNIFISVGLAFTFLGLISALASAVEGIEQAAGDTQSIQASISGLL